MKYLTIILFFLSCTSSNIEEKKQAVASNETTDKPNIILILADDIGYDILRCNNDTSIYQTPNLDQMAANGMRFTGCHSLPSCSPSRTQLLSGQYNFRNYTHWGIYDTTHKTFANMLSDSGYATYIAGKWQADGGDASIHAMGFQNYDVVEAFDSGDGVKGAKAYFHRNPKIYDKNAYHTYTNNEYGDDIFTDSIISFAASATQPFFIYYTTPLCHEPVEPTPDDSEYLTWKIDSTNERFFASMVKYMDKKIGQIIHAIDSMNSNTIIIFIGDNGTAKIGKGTATEAGTKVPLIVYWRGHITASVNNSLIDFTDFLPTLAGMANIPVPTNYGVLDGISFYPQLFGDTSNQRQWSFTYYLRRPELNDGKIPIRYVQDKIYKKLDSANRGLFYNIKNDPLEKFPISKKNQKVFERKIAAKDDSIMNTMHN